MRKILEQDKIIKEGVHYEFHLYNGDWDIYLVKECQKLGPDYLDIRRHWAVLRNGIYNKTVSEIFNSNDSYYSAGELEYMLNTYFSVKVTKADIEHRDLYAFIAENILYQNTVQQIEGNGYVPPFVFLFDTIALLKKALPDSNIELVRNGTVESMVVEGTYDHFEIKITVNPISAPTYVNLRVVGIK